MAKIIDPDITELREFISKRFERLLDKETLEYEGEIAIYWFANYYHSGLWSNLYTTMCAVQYNPGRMINNIEDENEIAIQIFNSIAANYFPETIN